MLELFANDAFCGKAKPIAIEGQRFFEIVNADPDDCYSWLHVQFSPSGITQYIRHYMSNLSLACNYNVFKYSIIAKAPCLSSDQLRR